MIVCIAEKPSVAEDIAKIIGATQRHRVGRNAGYFEGNGYQVTWTFGHLCELKDPEQYTPYWKTWSLSALPMIPERFGIRLKEGVEEQFGVIRELFGKAERIINCGDAGQEGELIQRWVMQKASAQCPVERLWISSMTEEAIREGFAQLRPQEEYRGLYEAGLCRAIGDWLLGMNATRLYTLKFGDRSRRGAQPLSIGRVQTPTLALIVHRQQEIERFVPEPYWVLSTVYRDTTFTARLDTGEEEEETKTAERERTENKGTTKRGFTDRAEAEAALRAIENTPFTVTAVTKKKGSEAPTSRHCKWNATANSVTAPTSHSKSYNNFTKPSTPLTRAWTPPFFPTTCTARARGFSTGSRDCTAISSRRCAERSCTSRKRCSIRRK